MNSPQQKEKGKLFQKQFVLRSLSDHGRKALNKVSMHGMSLSRHTTHAAMRVASVIQDKEKRNTFISRLQEKRVIRNWHTFILLPCVILFSFCTVAEIAFELSSKKSISTPTVEVYNQSFPSIPSSKLATNSEESSTNTVIDVISVGMIHRPEYHEAQMRTLGKHASVRGFFPVNERNDTDVSCHDELGSNQIEHIMQFCSSTEGRSFISSTIRKHLFQPEERRSGWMCAQKRPEDALYSVLQQYKTDKTNVPDYLLLIDDDTYINMNDLTVDLQEYYPVDVPSAIAGCNQDFLKESGITFPHHGFGSYLTKAAIQKLMRPIHCDRGDEHSILACWRLNIDALGEKQFFRDGMSVIELMHAYGSELPFSQAEKWTDTGYCFHSNHALAYFVNFYHIPVPDGTLSEHYNNVPKDKIRRRHSFADLLGGNGTECKYEKENCGINSRVCHSVSPSQMDALYRAQR